MLLLAYLGEYRFTKLIDKSAQNFSFYSCYPESVRHYQSMDVYPMHL